MRKIEQNIYNFNELKEDIREKLIENEIEYQAETYCNNFLKDDMEEEAKRLLQKYFGKNATFNNVYYDLSYCQGSGAMIEFEGYYYNKYIKIKHYGHYEHARSFIIDSYELTEKQENQLKEKIIKINEELEKIGFSLVEYTITKEEAIETLQENEYFENGEIYQ